MIQGPNDLLHRKPLLHHGSVVGAFELGLTSAETNIPADREITGPQSLKGSFTRAIAAGQGSSSLPIRMLGRCFRERSATASESILHGILASSR